MSKNVTISEMEYNSLRAATELLRHPDVLVRTLEAMGRGRAETLEDAFSQTISAQPERARAAKGRIRA
jgi:hypothetical protein